MPVVLPREEVEKILGVIDGTQWLMANLLYGTGMRLMECLRLRVKDVDFGYGQILIRDGKGEKDRITLLPSRLVEPLQTQLQTVRQLHDRDLREGFGKVHLPYALARKYPRAGFEWGWQYVFPSRSRSVDPEDGVIRRHHLDESVLPRSAQKCSPYFRNSKAGALSCLSPFFCHPPASIRLRHQNRPGIAGPFRCFHDDDLHPRAEQGWAWCARRRIEQGLRMLGMRRRRRYHCGEFPTLFTSSRVAPPGQACRHCSALRSRARWTRVRPGSCSDFSAAASGNTQPAARTSTAAAR